MAKFVKVNEIGFGEVIINLDTVIRIENLGNAYRLYFNVSQDGSGNYAINKESIYNIDIYDNIKSFIGL